MDFSRFLNDKPRNTAGTTRKTTGAPGSCFLQYGMEQIRIVVGFLGFGFFCGDLEDLLGALGSDFRRSFGGGLHCV